MNKLRLWVLVLAAAGILTGCDSCGGDTGITFDGPWQSVDQDKLNEIKNAFERYYPDIKVIEVRTSGTDGRVGDRIKLLDTYINSWALNGSEYSIHTRITTLYTTTTTKATPPAREAPRSIG